MRNLLLGVCLSLYALSCVAQQSNLKGKSRAPCEKAIENGAVCDAANEFALGIMRSENFEAITVVQDVTSGSLVAFAASEPSKLDVATPVLPLSLVKVFLAAVWWDNRLPDTTFESVSPRDPSNKKSVTIAEIIFNGSDSAGKQMATALRRSLGTRKVIETLDRFGITQNPGSMTNPKDWAIVPIAWQKRLKPKPAYFSASDQTSDDDWASDLSIGEDDFQVTALYVSQFMQAVGNGGVAISPYAFEDLPGSLVHEKQLRLQWKRKRRVMREATAKRLQLAMLETVRQGTARSAGPILADTGWQIGGKTGSMIRPIGSSRTETADGWFAGLIFDPKGHARFTVATFVRHGGLGGGNAARISANLAKFLIDRTMETRSR